MSYKELDERSTRVAHELRRRGLKLEESVIVFLPASCEFLVAILGILKAGGTYLPVDSDTPIQRLEFFVSDSASRFVISNVAGMERLRDLPIPLLDLEQIVGGSDRKAVDDLSVPSDPNRRAYIIYTSGSSGRPKGVEIEHHSLTNLVSHYHRYFKLTAQDRASMLAYVAFDASVADIWPTLCAGAVVTIPTKGILLNPDGLIEWLAKEEITLAYVPTGLAEILFTRPWPERIKLRFLLTGGDRLRVRPPAKLPFVVINAYGPTENTVVSTGTVVQPENGKRQAPPIGRPIHNISAYVLDERMQPVSVNVAGELYLGGEQVARGYLGHPEQTKELFVPDPFTNQPDARMYRTGDWVRWLEDGELDFLGRKDGQVKIHGWRVELGEIEGTLFSHGAVRQVCCVPRLIDGMPSGITAHVATDRLDESLSGELRSYLQARLPDYMVPSEFVLHESLPLTPQGKLDRVALTSFQATKSASPRLVVGEDGLEKALASLWQSLLPAAGNSPRDATFADLGGDSMLVIKLMLGVEEITGQRLEVSSFLVKPTFAGLCDAVRTRMARTEFEPVLALRRQGTRPPLFCLYGISGDIESYFNLAEALGDDQPVFGIRSPALEDFSRLPQSIEEAAAEVVRWIRKVQPQGAPSLVGYSWAGLLAFEVARQLAQAEGICCFTALIGPMAPMRPTHFTSRLAHFVRYFPPWLWNLITDQKDRGWRIMRWREMAARTRENLAEAHLPLEELVSKPIPLHLFSLMEKYRPKPGSKVTINIFREYDSTRIPAHPLHAWQTSHLPDGGWNRWVQSHPSIHWLEGDHWTIIKPPLVKTLAQAIRSAMDQHLKEKQNAPSKLKS